MPKHVFFDLDNTLTPSRQPMIPAHADLFDRLCDERDVIVVSGQELASFRSQLPAKSVGKYYVLSQVGNDAYDKDGTELWKERPTGEQTKLVLDFIALLRKTYPMEVKNENDIVELRGSLIGFCLIGHHEDPAKKSAFDPGSLERKAMLAAFPAEVARLREEGIDVTPAGTTTIEFFLAGRDKGYNIQRLIILKKWEKRECIYFGDELEVGRNDETVLGVIPTHKVANPDDTFRFIKENLLS
jgi:HAD superfamily hydrolase (TIGR01484 family)